MAWVASSFGFGDDLAYFGDVFDAFERHCPGAVVLLRHDFPVAAYPRLPLLPVLDFWVLATRRRLPSGVNYHGRRRFPRPRTLRVLWRLQPQVLVVTEFTPIALATWAVARARRIPIVLLVESDPSSRGGRSGRATVLVKSFVARRSAVVLTANPRGAAFCTSTLRVRRDRLLVGPYLTSAPAPPSAPAPMTDDDGVRLLFLNSLGNRKGLRELLDALARLSEETDARWHLDVVGTGPQEQALRQLTLDLGLGGRVTFHGHATYDAVHVHYSRCHVVVSPSLGDYRSLSGFEALNAGRPVLVSSRDGASEELHAAAPGSVVVVDPLDQDALVTALARLTDPRTAALALEAAAVPPPQFGLEAVGRNLADAVSRASRPHRRPGRGRVRTTR